MNRVAVDHPVTVKRHTEASGVTFEFRDEYTSETVLITEKDLTAKLSDLDYFLVRSDFLTVNQQEEKRYIEEQRGEQLKQRQQRQEEEDKRHHIEAGATDRVYFIINHFLGKSGRDRFPLDDAFEAVMADSEVASWLSRMPGSDAAQIFVNGMREQIRERLQKSKDSNGLREFRAVPNPNGHGYTWTRFTQMKADELHAVIAIAEERVTELQADLKNLYPFAEALRDRSPRAVVADVYDEVISQLKGAG